MKSATQDQSSATRSSVQPIPEGMHTVTPHLVCAGAADAIEFYKKAFGAKEQGRFDGPGGKIMHCEFVIGDSIIMMADEFPDMGIRAPGAYGGSPVSIALYVTDVDARFKQAVTAGALSFSPELFSEFAPPEEDSQTTKRRLQLARWIADPRTAPSAPGLNPVSRPPPGNSRAT